MAASQSTNLIQIPACASSHARVLASAATVGILASAVKLAGGVKVMATARFFGTSDSLDAFLIAFLLPSFISDVVAGSFTPSLIPILVRAESEEGTGAAQRLARLALTFAIGMMLAAAIGLAIAGKWVLPLAGSSFSPGKLQLTLTLFFGLLFWLPMSAFIATWRAVLNANRIFALPAIAPLAAPVIIVALLFTLASQWGVAVLCAGTVAGAAAECLMLACAVRKMGHPLRPAWAGWGNPELRAIRKQYFPLAASALISSGCVLVDQSVAGRLGPGQVSALVYGNKLTAVILGIIASAAGTAVLPAFSSMASSRDWMRLRRAVLMYSGATLLAVLPLTAALAASSPWLVRIFFQHGAFRATGLVTGIQRFSLLQIPFAMLLVFLTRLATALSRNALLVRMGAAALAADIVLDLVFSRWLGVAGIALATAAVQAISLLVLVSLLCRHEPKLARAAVG
ncbi:MAG TPA: lipid II flippase MurJ [Bryobacteraceae bacterium]|nr:lipid II flippase MurJ [Bryobacteraceae bacterium]